MISAGELISERVMLKRDRFFVVSARDGTIDRSEFLGDGLWDGDTRILSRLRLLVDGEPPQPLGLEADDAHVTFELAAAGLHITRTRFVEDGLHERITITNPGPAAVDGVLEIDAAADFAAMLGIRGAVRELAHPVEAAAAPTDDGLRFSHHDRASYVVVFPEGLRHQLRLFPGDELFLRLDVMPEPDRPTIVFPVGLHQARELYRRWESESMTVRTDNSSLNELLEQALDDIRMACNTFVTGLYPTGGLPWYAVPFGRDALISSMLLLPVNPEIARGVLRYQAAHQGKEVNPASQEEPGKILHEVRDGEAVERGLWPHILYTTVDATPLFLCALAETEAWTHDQQLGDELWPAAQAALEWCRAYGDVDADGYIEDRGIRYRNAGWKDSADSLTNIDGTEVARPVSLCEVQAYLHRGLVGMSRRSPVLREGAATLKRRFNHEFWMPDAKFIAQALDGHKHQVKAVSSNPGHCLWMRILDRRKATLVTRRLLEHDMFSGWGIRTLSGHTVNYDPCSYHNGSVWPFDTALAAVGMRQYGFAAQAEEVARALVDAAMEFPMRRPPELFCGDPRAPGEPPREYWNTCTPQLWSAAAMFACVTAILGIEPDPRHKTLRVAPIETRLWSWVEVTGLHFAGKRLDFGVRGTEVKSGTLPAGVRIDATLKPR